MNFFSKPLENYNKGRNLLPADREKYAQLLKTVWGFEPDREPAKR